MKNQPTLDRSAERIRGMFSQIAPRYDFLNHTLSLGIDRCWRHYVVKRIKPDINGLPILDLCCGSADLAVNYWVKYYKKGTYSFQDTSVNTPKIIAVDFCPEMLNVAEKKILKQGKKCFQDIQLLNADATDLPFSDEAFQIVTVAFGLRNVSSTEHALAEMARVCVSGGHVAILEFSHPSCRPLKWAYSFYFHHILPRVGQLIARNRYDAYNYLPRSVDLFPQGMQMAQLMMNAGLKNVTFQPLTFGIATLYDGIK